MTMEATSRSEQDAIPGPPAVPAQRSPVSDNAWFQDKPKPEMRASASTDVLPYPVSVTSKRTRPLRAWMITAPADALALLAPLVWTIQYWKGTLAMACLTILIFAAGGLYRARRHISILDELPALIGRLLIAMAVVAIAATLRHESVPYVAGFIQAVAISAGLVLAGRFVTRSINLFARQRRWVEHNAVIIGSGPIAVELARLVRRYPRYGLRFAGYVDEAPRRGAPPLLGTLDNLSAAVSMSEADVLILADPDAPEPALWEVLRRPDTRTLDLWVVPRLWGSRSQGGLTDHIGAIPLVQLRHAAFSGPRWWIKRTTDIVFAVACLVLVSPIMLLTAFAVWAESGFRHGVFFRQERVGLNGRLFEVYKFRSMRPVNEKESQTQWSIANDKRVGPVGRFIRRTSLDELPQLWNILRGDMTVVGPRPERPHFVEQFSAEHPEYAMRHRVPVGLTGLAQVSGLRGDTPISDRTRFDNYYIENWSLWLDVKVVIRTFSEVLRGGGR
ncbi:sugar transferase [Catenuloplanes japonicus]|uniref:sugar transferase n=1 Tax=Catenuloplanes japonicus TaxID=33876 RepID=UPI001E428209|nr:sugar transferase [Catenuloplanes japonicus]